MRTLITEGIQKHGYHYVIGASTFTDNGTKHYVETKIRNAVMINLYELITASEQSKQFLGFSACIFGTSCIFEFLRIKEGKVITTNTINNRVTELDSKLNRAVFRIPVRKP